MKSWQESGSRLSHSLPGPLYGVARRLSQEPHKAGHIDERNDGRWCRYQDNSVEEISISKRSSKRDSKTGVKHMYVEQEPPFKDVPALEAAEIDYHVLKSLLS